MLTMTNWRLCVPPDYTIGFQGDHLTQIFAVETDLPDGWSLKLDVECAGRKNIIDLTRTDAVHSAVLTAAMLADDGLYTGQLRGLCGEQVAHSNTFQLRVLHSINATKAFPDLLPSEFEQMEARVTDLKEQTEQAAVVAASTPYIAPENQHWMVYHRDAGAYVDSGVKAQGEPGRDGADGLDGDTPYIKFGTWWVGDRDTGVPASGEVENAQPLTNQELEELLGGL